jgi:hypothetical protein
VIADAIVTKLHNYNLWLLWPTKWLCDSPEVMTEQGDKGKMAGRDGSGTRQNVSTWGLGRMPLLSSFTRQHAERKRLSHQNITGRSRQGTADSPDVDSQGTRIVAMRGWEYRNRTSEFSPSGPQRQLQYAGALSTAIPEIARRIYERR